MIYTSTWTSWQTTNPIVLFCILAFTFPFDHCIIVTWIRSSLSQTLSCSIIRKLWIRRSKTMMRFFLTHFFLYLFMIKFGSVKWICWNRSISSRIGLFKTSFATFFSLFFMFIYPKFMVCSLNFEMRNFLVRIVASRAWNSIWKILSILIKISFLIDWEFFSLLFILWLAS